MVVFKASDVALVLSILCLGVVQISLVSALYRAFQRSQCARAMKLCRIAMVASAVWAIGSTVVLSLRCDWNAYMLPGSTEQVCPEAVREKGAGESGQLTWGL